MVASDEVGSELEFGSVRIWIPRAGMLFGWMRIAVRQSAIGLGRPVDAVGGHRGHSVDAAKMAGIVKNSSVGSGVG